MSEKTLKLSDGRDVSYTGTVREIVKSCHDMALKGMAVNIPIAITRRQLKFTRMKSEP